MNLIEKLEALEKEFIQRSKQAVNPIHELAVMSTSIGVAQAIDTVKQHQAENDWVPVSERLPAKEKDYLVRYEQSENFGLYMAVSTFRLNTQRFDCFNSKVTHWRELPQPPKRGAR